MEINELQAIARAGDRSAEDELFARLIARFRLFARQRIRNEADAEEVIQDTLKTIFEKYREIDFESSFAAWAYQVLTYKLKTYLSTRTRRDRKLEEERSRLGGRAAANAEPDLERRLQDCLRQVNRANQRHARILNLHYHGYTVAEICARLQLTRTNFYTILSRARTMLADCLDKGGAK